MLQDFKVCLAISGYKAEVYSYKDVGKKSIFTKTSVKAK